MSDTTQRSDDDLNSIGKAIRVGRAMGPILAVLGTVIGGIFTWGVMSANRSRDAAEVKQFVDRHDAALIRNEADDAARDRALWKINSAIEAIGHEQAEQRKQLDRILDRIDRKGAVGMAAPARLPEKS